MKKILALIFIVIMVLTFSACNQVIDMMDVLSEEKQAYKTYESLTKEEVEQLYTNPNAYKDRSVALSGKVLEIARRKNSIAFQMLGDPTNSKTSTMVAYTDPTVDVKSGDYIKVNGTMISAMQGKSNGKKVLIPTIIADSLEVVGYIDALSPTIKSVDIQESQILYGHSITVEKVEFAQTETRIYLTIQNNGKGQFSIFSSQAKIVQNGKQYEYQFNPVANYPEIQMGLLPGATTEGIITFPPLDMCDFKVAFEDSMVNLYIFDVEVTP